MPTPSRPRDFHWGPRELTFAILWLGFAAWFLVDGAYGVTAEIRCEREGRVVEGMVLTKYRKILFRTVKGLLTRSILEPRISYRFTLPDGGRMRGDSPIAEDRWRALRERGPVMVRFVPGHPSFNRVDGERNLLAPVVTASIGVGLFGLWILLFGLSSLASLAMWLLSRATPRESGI